MELTVLHYDSTNAVAFYPPSLCARLSFTCWAILGFLELAGRPRRGRRFSFPSSAELVCLRFPANASTATEGSLFLLARTSAIASLLSKWLILGRQGSCAVENPRRFGSKDHVTQSRNLIGRSGISPAPHVSLVSKHTQKRFCSSGAVADGREAKIRCRAGLL